MVVKNSKKKKKKRDKSNENESAEVNRLEEVNDKTE